MKIITRALIDAFCWWSKGNADQPQFQDCRVTCSVVNTTDIGCSIVEGVCSGTRWEVWIPVLIFPAGYQGLSWYTYEIIPSGKDAGFGSTFFQQKVRLSHD